MWCWWANNLRREEIASHVPSENEDFSDPSLRARHALPGTKKRSYLYNITVSMSMAVDGEFFARMMVMRAPIMITHSQPSLWNLSLHMNDTTAPKMRFDYCKTLFALAGYAAAQCPATLSTALVCVNCSPLLLFFLTIKPQYVAQRLQNHYFNSSSGHYNGGMQWTDAVKSMPFNMNPYEC